MHIEEVQEEEDRLLVTVSDLSSEPLEATVYHLWRCRPADVEQLRILFLESATYGLLRGAVIELAAAEDADGDLPERLSDL